VTIGGTTGGWYELDVSSYVKAERAAGRKAVGLALVCPATASPAIYLNSDEATNNQPLLVFVP
jgi:hypothetical protein